jgi:ketosteroid isomerase-like protein
MSQANVELMRRGYEAFASGDIETVIATLDPNLEARDHGAMPDRPTTFHGLQGFFELVTGVNEGFSEFLYTPEEFVDCGDVVFVRVRRTARGSASGATVEELQYHVWDISDGRAVRLRSFLDPAQATQAAGLPWRVGETGYRPSAAPATGHTGPERSID